MSQHTKHKNRQHQMKRVAGGYVETAPQRQLHHIFDELDALRLAVATMRTKGAIDAHAYELLQQMAYPALQRQADAEEATARALRAEANASERDRAIDELKRALHAEREHARTLEKELLEQRTVATRTLPSLQGELAEMQTGLAEAVAEIKSLRGALDHERAQTTALRGELARESELARAASSELEEGEAACKSAQAECQRLQEELRDEKAGRAAESQRLQEELREEQAGRAAARARALATEERLAETMTSAATAALQQQHEANRFGAEVRARDEALARAEATTHSVLRDVAHAETMMRELSRAREAEAAELSRAQADLLLLQANLQTETKRADARVEEMRRELASRHAGLEEELRRARLHANEAEAARKATIDSATAAVRDEQRRAHIARTALAEIQGALLRSEERALSCSGALPLGVTSPVVSFPSHLDTATPVGP